MRRYREAGLAGMPSLEIHLPLLQRFMRIRGGPGVERPEPPWKERGTEQAAEVLTTGLGEGEIDTLLPEQLDPATLADLYELLTGRPPITPDAA